MTKAAKKQARCNICGRFGRKDSTLPCTSYDPYTGRYEHS